MTQNPCAMMAPTQLAEICSAFFGLCHKIENVQKIFGEFFKIKSPLNYFRDHNSALFCAV